MRSWHNLSRRAASHSSPATETEYSADTGRPDIASASEPSTLCHGLRTSVPRSGTGRPSPPPPILLTPSYLLTRSFIASVPSWPDSRELGAIDSYSLHLMNAIADESFRYDLRRWGSVTTVAVYRFDTSSKMHTALRRHRLCRQHHESIAACLPSCHRCHHGHCLRAPGFPASGCRP